MSHARSARRGGASVTATPATLGRIPPHLLPDREELSQMTHATPHAQYAQSPSRPQRHFRSPMRSVSHPWTDGRGYMPPPSVGGRSPSPVHNHPVERGTTSERKVLAATGKQCPYGWHASPEKIAVVEKPVAVPMRSAEQDSELRLMRQQLQLALEQVRVLKADNESLQKIASPNANDVPPPVIPVEVAGQPIHQFLSKIDEVISHHETVLENPTGMLSPASPLSPLAGRGHRAPTGVASPVSPPAMGAGGNSPAPGADDSEPLEQRLQRQLDASQKTVAQQQSRIDELSARLKHREEHIESLTKSLIDLGQHNARLQAQVRGIVNEPPRTAFVPEGGGGADGMNPLKMLETIQQQQRAVRQRDEEALRAFDSVASQRGGALAILPQNGAAAATTPGAAAATPVNRNTDLDTILSAIEDHRVRADQIVELNRQSVELIKSYKPSTLPTQPPHGALDAASTAPLTAPASVPTTLADTADRRAPPAQEDTLLPHDSHHHHHHHLVADDTPRTDGGCEVTTAAATSAAGVTPRDELADAGRAPAPTTLPVPRAPPSQATSATAASAPSLPPDHMSTALAARGWVARFDANLQRSYFYNDELGKVCWTVGETGVDVANAAEAVVAQHVLDVSNILSPSRVGDSAGLAAAAAAAAASVPVSYASQVSQPVSYASEPVSHASQQVSQAQSHVTETAASTAA